ncbi:MAG: hypothetical protein ABJN65_01830 [Parasphingorhabdus sp.]
MALPAALADITGSNDQVDFVVSEIVANTPFALQSKPTFRDWLNGQDQFSGFEFAKPINRSLYQQRQRKMISLNIGDPPVKPINDNQAHSQFPVRPAGVQTTEQQLVSCCKKPTEELSRTRIDEFLDAKKKPERLQNSRLSAYFWLFAREGSSSASSSPFNSALQPGSAQYGGSQAGAILTYRLAGNHSRNVALYSRVSTALAVKKAGEVAFGAKIKPVKGIPISLYAEKRFRESALGNPGTAVFVAGGTGPDQIMHDTFLETYGQAGYVFQDDDSYFFDGSASVQKKLSSIGAGKISVGGAIWAGGQEGVRRVDVGPRVNIDAPFGNISTRVSIDWRQRVTGNAQPGSGLAVSLSSSF